MTPFRCRWHDEDVIVVTMLPTTYNEPWAVIMRIPSGRIGWTKVTELRVESDEIPGDWPVGSWEIQDEKVPA